jgi:nicotinate-nucleotide adenylyltransferase
MRIALFGGSFNPPHVSHQLACAYVLATARPAVDEVWMVPTFKHPFDKQLASYADRVAMCERAAAPFGGRVKVSRIEESLGGESYTLNTVQTLMAQHPGVRFSLVIGADLLAELDRWHRWPELEKLIEIIVVGRGGHPGGGGGGPEVALPPVSSTEVRARLAAGDAVDSLVDARVIDYIREKGLYRT